MWALAVPKLESDKFTLGRPNRASLVLRAIDAHLPPSAVLTAGNRVRVQLGAGTGAVVGEFGAITPGSLSFRYQHSEVFTALPIAEVSRLSVSHGQRRHPVEGAAIGGITGAVVGVVLTTKSDAFLPGFVELPLCTALGLSTGVLTGSLVKTDVWSRLDATRLPR